MSARRLPAATAAVAFTVLFSGCGTAASQGQGEPVPALETLSAALIPRLDAPLRDGVASLDEVDPRSDVVLGHITSVESGVGGKPSTADEEWAETTFDDGDAFIRTYEFKFVVEEVLAGEISAEAVHVGLALNSGVSPTDVEDGLIALGDVVLFLYKGSPVFAYNSALFGIGGDGATVITVDDGGRLEMPFVTEEAESDLLGSWKTIDDLRKDFKAPV